MKLVLASQSPRRRELLHNAGLPHTTRPAHIDETRLPGEPPIAYVRRLAQAKAEAVVAAPGEIILAADTTVAIENHVLEKPADAEDARRMLRLLSGLPHQVYTGICLRFDARLDVAHEETTVTFHPLTDEEIEAYVASGEPMDKAGAYGIQGLASKFVARVEGCFFNVVGLPVALVYRRLRLELRPGMPLPHPLHE
ncbi:MAG: Maf family protein [Bryobacteraceae bacterium]|nr:Maf family protein [Bryobacteraceae bacterium]